MAIVKKYKATVENIRNPLAGIYTITFSSQKKFKYSPGQFLHLALDDYDGVGQWPESRCFSMQSNPNDEMVKITFATKGKYTQRMSEELLEKKIVWLKMPYGDIFQRGHVKNNCIFIAGGTGLTPFLSLFTDTSFKGYEKPVLYAGFKNKNFNIFDNELNLAKNINKEFQVNIICENQKGILDINKIYQNQKEATNYFISGPPIMIKNFRNYLLQKGIKEINIVTDDWE